MATAETFGEAIEIATSEDAFVSLNKDNCESVFGGADAQKVSIIAVFGPPKSGKSTLLGKMMRHISTEVINSGISGPGIDDHLLQGFLGNDGNQKPALVAWSKPFVVTKGVRKKFYVYFLDIRGTFLNNNDPNYIALAGLAMLMSSSVLYIQKQRLQATALECFLPPVLQGLRTTEQTGVNCHQKLSILINDWTDTQEFLFGDKPSQQYLNQFLSQNKTPTIQKLFLAIQTITCCLLPTPEAKQFPHYFKRFLDNILDEELLVKKVQSSEFSGEDVFQLMKEYVDTIIDADVNVNTFEISFDNTSGNENEKQIPTAIETLTQIRKSNMMSQSQYDDLDDEEFKEAVDNSCFGLTESNDNNLADGSLVDDWEVIDRKSLTPEPPSINSTPSPKDAPNVLMTSQPTISLTDFLKSIPPVVVPKKTAVNPFDLIKNASQKEFAIEERGRCVSLSSGTTSRQTVDYLKMEPSGFETPLGSDESTSDDVAIAASYSIYETHLLRSFQSAAVESELGVDDILASAMQSTIHDPGFPSSLKHRNLHSETQEYKIEIRNAIQCVMAYQAKLEGMYGSRNLLNGADLEEAHRLAYDLACVGYTKNSAFLNEIQSKMIDIYNIFKKRVTKDMKMEEELGMAGIELANKYYLEELKQMVESFYLPTTKLQSFHQERRQAYVEAFIKSGNFKDQHLCDKYKGLMQESLNKIFNTQEVNNHLKHKASLVDVDAVQATLLQKYKTSMEASTTGSSKLSLDKLHNEMMSAHLEQFEVHIKHYPTELISEKCQELQEKIRNAYSMIKKNSFSNSNPGHPLREPQTYAESPRSSKKVPTTPKLYSESSRPFQKPGVHQAGIHTRPATIGIHFGVDSISAAVWQGGTYTFILDTANALHYVEELVLGKSDHPSHTFNVGALLDQPDPSQYETPFRYAGSQSKFCFEELVALVLLKVKQRVEYTIGQALKHCVIAVPPYLHENQRKQIYNGAKIANFEVVRIISELDAVAIHNCGPDYTEKNQSPFLVIQPLDNSCSAESYKIHDGVIRSKIYSGTLNTKWLFSNKNVPTILKETSQEFQKGSGFRIVITGFRRDLESLEAAGEALKLSTNVSFNVGSDCILRGASFYAAILGSAENSLEQWKSGHPLFSTIDIFDDKLVKKLGGIMKSSISNKSGSEINDIKHNIQKLWTTELVKSSQRKAEFQQFLSINLSNINRSATDVFLKTATQRKINEIDTILANFDVDLMYLKSKREEIQHLCQDLSK